MAFAHIVVIDGRFCGTDYAVPDLSFVQEDEDMIFSSVGRRTLLLFAATALFGQTKPPLVIILLGPPGSGKSTQSEKITAEFGIPGVSTGALLRAEVAAGTPLGQKIDGDMKKGALIGDDIVNDLVVARFAKPDAARGLILDGYPRTVEQARFLDQLLAKRKSGAPLVLNFTVTKEQVTQRMANRGRADDQPQVVAERLAVYERETKPLLDFYAAHGVKNIESTGTPDQIFQRVRAILQNQ
jgi:adenylate kinase